MTSVIEHGTRNGYDAHIRAGEKACDPCAAAKSDSVQGQKIRCGKTLSTRVPVEVLGELLLRLDEELLDEVSDAIGHEVAAACMDVASWRALNREARSA